MGIEEGTDMRDNRKEELTTDRFGGEAWEGERSNNNREILSLDGREDGDTINKSRLQRKWCRVEREDDNSVLYTLRCGDVFFSPGT